MRTGSDGQREFQLYRRFEAAHRNELWEADHKELSLRVMYDGAVVRPWATVFIDAFSRAVPAAVLSPGRPTHEDVLACFFEAVTISPVSPVGGLPLIVRWDNDTTFTADAVTGAVAGLGCAITPTDAYTPYQKGKIERFNKTIEQRFSRVSPGWEHGPKTRNREHYDRDEVLLDWTELLERFDAFLSDYNQVWKNRGVANRCPADVWAADDAELRTCGKDDLYWVLPAEPRKVAKGGIRFKNEDYFSADLANLVGEQVEVRCFPHDGRRIEVCRDGKWLCSAVPQSQVSEAESDLFFKERGRTTARINTRLRLASSGGELAVGDEQTVTQEPTQQDVRQANAELVDFLNLKAKRANRNG